MPPAAASRGMPARPCAGSDSPPIRATHARRRSWSAWSRGDRSRRRHGRHGAAGSPIAEPVGGRRPGRPADRQREAGTRTTRKTRVSAKPWRCGWSTTTRARRGGSCGATRRSRTMASAARRAVRHDRTRRAGRGAGGRRRSEARGAGRGVAGAARRRVRVRRLGGAGAHCRRAGRAAGKRTDPGSLARPVSRPDGTQRRQRGRSARRRDRRFGPAAAAASGARRRS